MKTTQQLLADCLDELAKLQREAYETQTMSSLFIFGRLDEVKLRLNKLIKAVGAENVKTI